ncbi:hypothetical protein ACHAXS_005460, partial [Conticribra weissflogii]
MNLIDAFSSSFAKFRTESFSDQDRVDLSGRSGRQNSSRNGFGLSNELGDGSGRTGIGEALSAGIGNLLDLSGRSAMSRHNSGDGLSAEVGGKIEESVARLHVQHEEDDDEEDCNSLLESFGHANVREDDDTPNISGGQDDSNARNIFLNGSKSNAPFAVIPSSSGGALNQESLNALLVDLGRSTESLLRTMKLDVVMLSSMEKEAKITLDKLNREWLILEGMMAEYRKRRPKRTLAYDVIEEEKEGAGIGRPSNFQIISSAQSHSQNHKKESSGSSYSTMGTQSTQPTAGSYSPSSSSKSSNAITSVVTSNVGNGGDPNRDKNAASSALKNHSNFDWGYDVDQELLDEAKRASLNGVPSSVLDELNKPESDLGPSLTSTSGSGVAAAGGSLLGWVRKKSVENQLQRRYSECNSAGIIQHETSKINSSQWQLFGGRGKHQEGDDSTANENSQQQGAAQLHKLRSYGSIRKVNESSWPKMLIGRASAGGESNAEDAEDAEVLNRVPEGANFDVQSVKSGDQREQPKSKSSYRNSTIVISSMDDIGNLPPLPANHPYCALSDREMLATLSKLQLKLRGFDSAAASLQQLVFLQKRNQLDLHCERNHLEKATKSASQQAQLELESLRQILEFSKAERRRKMRLLEAADQKRQKTQHREDMLQEELETVRMELSMLNTQVRQLERSHKDDLAGGLSSVQPEMRSATRQRVLIVGGSGGDEDEENIRQRRQQQIQQRRLHQQQQLR